MFGALKALEGRDLQFFLTANPEFSWFQHSWPTSFQYGYCNIELKGIGTQGAGETQDFEISACPQDIACRLVFEASLPPVDHCNNRGKHRHYLPITQISIKEQEKLKIKKKKKSKRYNSSSSSSSSTTSSSDSWSSSTDSSSSSTDSSASSSSRGNLKYKQKYTATAYIDDDIEYLPTHHAYWNQQIAHNGVKKISWFVGGIEMTSCEGDFMNVMDNVSQTFDHNTDEEVGRYTSDLELYKASLRPQVRYFEPWLSFNESLNRHWPIYLSRHIKSVVRLEMEPLHKWYISTDHSIPSLLEANRELTSADIKIRCFADVYVLTPDEIEREMKLPCKQYLLLRNHKMEKEIPPTTTDTPVVIDLPFKNPCMQFFFTVQEKRNRDMKDYHNYWYKRGDSILEAKFTIEDSDIIGWRRAPFWRQYTAKNYSRKPTCPIYIIPANLFPEKPDLPSGNIDCTHNKVKLWLRLPIGMGTAIVKVFTRSYDMITFTKSVGGKHTVALAEPIQSS